MNDVKPLAGLRIAVTRARHQAPPLEALIRDFGGKPVPYPCIAISPPTDPRPLEACLRRLGEFDWLLLTSGNTVRAIAERLPDLGIQLAEAPVRVAAAGPATAAEARRRLSLDVQHVPAEYGAGQSCAKPATERALPTSATTIGPRGRVNGGGPKGARRTGDDSRRLPYGYGRGRRRSAGDDQPPRN